MSESRSDQDKKDDSSTEEIVQQIRDSDDTTKMRDLSDKLIEKSKAVRGKK